MVSRSGGGQRIRFRAPSLRAAKERSRRKASLGSSGEVKADDSADKYRTNGKKRAKGKGLGAHGSWRRQRLGLPPLRPLVLSDVTGPAPFSQRNQVVPFLPAPSRPGADSHWAGKNTCSPGHARAGAAKKRRSAGGARSVGRGFPGEALDRARRN